MLFINFKTYREASGEKAIYLAKLCEEVAQDSGISIIPCVQAVDLSSVVKAVNIPVWVQHLDCIKSGKNTGYVTAETIKSHGGQGTLLNHSEHPLALTELKITMNLCRQSGLKTLVLAPNLKTAKTIDGLKPDYLGLEEPSLIGTGTAMVKSASLRKIISQFVSQTQNAIPVIGAGISTPEDISQSLALGAKGALVASAVVLAKNPKTVLQEMAKVFY